MKAAVRSRYGPPDVLSVQVMSLGADKVVDYKTEDFTRDTERYDFIVDAVDKTSYAACRKLMRNDGVYTSSAGFENPFLALITRLHGRKRALFLVRVRRDGPEDRQRDRDDGLTRRPSSLAPRVRRGDDVASGEIPGRCESFRTTPQLTSLIFRRS